VTIQEIARKERETDHRSPLDDVFLAGMRISLCLNTLFWWAPRNTVTAMKTGTEGPVAEALEEATRLEECPKPQLRPEVFEREHRRLMQMLMGDGSGGRH